MVGKYSALPGIEEKQDLHEPSFSLHELLREKQLSEGLYRMNRIFTGFTG